MMKKLIKGERGQSLILIALALVVLLGITAVVIDVGTVKMQKAKLQSAIDAAALAAAQSLPNTSSATAAANSYVQKNGFPSSSISVSFPDTDEVKVQASTTVPYTFAQVLGVSYATVDNVAVAEVGKVGGPFNYAIFSGSSTVDLPLSGDEKYKLNIQGDVHTNKSLDLDRSTGSINGTAEAFGAIKNNTGVSITQIETGSPNMAMPDFTEKIKQIAIANGNYYTGDQTFGKPEKDIKGAIYVEGDLIINDSAFKGTGSILVTGNVYIKSSSFKTKLPKPICIYSQNGNVTIDGDGDMDFFGILYAPQGKVSVNASNMNIEGSVVANEIEFDVKSGQIDIDASGGSANDALPSTGIKLIE